MWQSYPSSRNVGLRRLPQRLAYGMPRRLPCFHLRSLRENMLGSLPDGDPNGDRPKWINNNGRADAYADTECINNAQACAEHGDDHRL